MFFLKNFKNYKLKTNKGFTIIELVVSISILVVAIIGVYSAFSVILIESNNLSCRFVAVYLAQEGLEIVRNIRDNNWIKSIDDPEIQWTNGLLGFTNGFEADYKTGTQNEFTPPRQFGEDGSFLNIDDNGFYSYDTVNATETKYKRKITVLQQEADVILVSVLVTWDYNGKNFQFSADEYLYNWY